MLVYYHYLNLIQCLYMHYNNNIKNEMK